jgi:hypothetical protein
MRYALLVCNDDSAEVTPAEEAARFAFFNAFADTMLERGVLRDRGMRLRPTITATTVRVRGGDVVIADGPFAETKEQIGGFYLIDCEDLDEAIEIASQVPSARYGSIEVRPVWEF